MSNILQYKRSALELNPSWITLPPLNNTASPSTLQISCNYKYTTTYHSSSSTSLAISSLSYKHKAPPMDPQSRTLSLSFELTIIRARNINLKSDGELFVRCYLSAGKNRRVKLDSKQISSKSDLIWDQTFSLDCSGSQESIRQLKRGTIIFELRRRSSSSATFIGRVIKGSELVGRAEMPFKEGVNMEILKWVVMMPQKGCVDDGVKPPAVQIAIKVEESAKAVVKSEKRWSECGCMDSSCSSCVGYELFAIGAALEAF